MCPNDSSHAAPSSAQLASATQPDAHADTTALVIVDMLTDWAFPDGDTLLGAAVEVAPRIAALRDRCAAARLPVVHVTDRPPDHCDPAQRLARALARGDGSARVAELLRPRPGESVLFKPKHSGFFGTSLESLLHGLAVRRLLLVGSSTDQCILLTAADAKMRDFEVCIVRDCCASLGAARDARAFALMRESLRLEVDDAAQVPLGSAPSRR